MGYAVRERKCDTCPTVVKGRIPPSGEFHCVECNIKHAADAAIQMANKCGPAYDKWLETRGPQGRPRNS